MEIVIGLILGLFVGAGIGYVVRKSMAEKEVSFREKGSRRKVQGQRPWSIAGCS